MNNVINLGELPVCSEAVVLPVDATETGTWAFMTTFNGAYQYVQFTATAGQKIVVPAKLNEDYTYSFKLYQPDSSLFNDATYWMKTIPMLPDVEYVCPSVNSAGTTFTTGKIQLIASDDQVEVTMLELLNADNVVVFVEGLMRYEGSEADEYVFSAIDGKVVFNTALTEGQKITILYFK